MRTLLISLLFLPALVSAQPALEVFTQNTSINDVIISPEGTYIAFTGYEDDLEYISVIQTDDRSTVLDKLSLGEGVPIAAMAWINDDRLIIKGGAFSFGATSNTPQPINRAQIRNQLMNQGSFPGQIYAMDADGENFEVLLGIEKGSGATRISQSDRPGSGQIVDLNLADPDVIIVQDAPFGFGPRTPRNSAYNIDINSGKLSKIIGSPIANGTFITDANNQVTYVSGFNTNGEQVLYGIQDGEWELILNSQDDDWFQPVASLDDNGKMLVSTSGDNSTNGYSVWDPENNSVSPLFHHDVVDASDILRDQNNKVWAIRYHDHYPEYVYLNEEHPYSALHINLRRQLSAYDIEIVDATDDFSKVILFISNPQNPGEYLWMDTEKMQYLQRMASYKDFPSDQLGRMDPFELIASDGTMLRGYLTLPPGATEQNLPMVVLPHDGPHNSYDTWSYQKDVQILASNGYAVLQINFRGSDGRGETFKEAGYGEWGGVMQNDIIDAVRWAIAEGVADQERICIGGSGFGGYAALTATFQEPELFQCAVGISGLYDLSLVTEAAEEMEGPIMDLGLNRLLEIFKNNASLIDSRSPVANADKISANIMLIHDKTSFIAPMEHAERMKEALESAGKDVTWVVETRSNESVMSRENQLNVYGQILEFLEENIGN